jgi:transcription elongation factor/antiterminator RfaH
MLERWYVIHSKPHKEGLLSEQLSVRKIENYYPCLHVRPVNPRCHKIKPYFPGYLFVRIDLAQVGWSTISWVPGVAGLVSFGGEPADVSQNLIDAIRQRVNKVDRTGSSTTIQFKKGEILIIQEGPFAGYEAIFNASLPGSERVKVLLKLLNDQRQVPLELPALQVSRI